MKFFFVPGRQADLSYAELCSVLSSNRYDFTVERKDMLFLVNIDVSEAEISRMFNKMGGFTRFGVVLEDVDLFISGLVHMKKVVFGISVFRDGSGFLKDEIIKKLSIQFKLYFKEVGIHSRYLYSRADQLGICQIIKNSVLEKGFELSIFENNGNLIYAKTLGVQDIDLYSKVEFGKPVTDKKTGVLPAKLARILVNLSRVHEGGKLWDPFCGSGTIPMMALLNGIDVYCSDIDPSAVTNCKKNIEWLGTTGLLSSGNMDAFEFDILNPDKKILSQLRKSNIDGLACEPDMGPPQFRVLSEGRANVLLNNIKNLYVSLFSILSHLKLENFTAVVVIPAYKTHKGWMTLSISEIVGKKWDILNRKYGRDLHWMRSNSIIKRNIFVLYKKR